MTRRLGLGFVAAGLLFLSSCYRVDANLTVENDGSGQFGYVVAFNYEAFVDLDRSNGASRDDFCTEVTSDQSDLLEGAVVEEYDEDGYCGLRITVGIAANDDFRAALGEAADEGSGASNDLQDFDIAKVADDQWNFFLSFEDSDLSELDGTSAESPEEVEQLRIIQETLEISYTIELPGEAGDHNADSTSSSDGRTRFEWEIDPYAPLESLTATTIPSYEPADKPGSATNTPPPLPNDTDPAEGDTAPDTAGRNEPEIDDDGATPGNAVDDLPFAEEAKPAVTSSGPATAILLLGLFAILVLLGGVVALVLKWPGRKAAAAPDFGAQPGPDPSMAPPHNPFGGHPQNGPPQNGPPQSGLPPSGPPQSGSQLGGPPPPLN